MTSVQGRRRRRLGGHEAPGSGSNGASRTASLPPPIDQAPPARRTIIELRGWAKHDGNDTYMRTCVYCGWFECSDDVRLLWLYLRCPLCDGSDVPEAA